MQVNLVLKFQTIYCASFIHSFWIQQYYTNNFCFNKFWILLHTILLLSMGDISSMVWCGVMRFWCMLCYAVCCVLLWCNVVWNAVVLCAILLWSHKLLLDYVGYLRGKQVESCVKFKFVIIALFNIIETFPDVVRLFNVLSQPDWVMYLFVHLAAVVTVSQVVVAATSRSAIFMLISKDVIKPKPLRPPATCLPSLQQIWRGLKCLHTQIQFLPSQFCGRLFHLNLIVRFQVCWIYNRDSVSFILPT